MKRKIFLDPTLQAKFDKNGYVVVPFLKEQEIKELSQKYKHLPSVDTNGFYSSMHIRNKEFKKKGHELLLDYGRRLNERYLHQYKTFLGFFFMKVPGENSSVGLHQDWTFVDEERFTSLNIWCPLVDVNRKNGALFLLKGGHRIDPPVIRGTLVPFASESVSDLMNYDTMTYLPMKAGEAVIYDHQVLHLSPPNQSRKSRLAFSIPAVPEEAMIFHYFQNPESGKLEKYEVGIEFFLSFTFGDQKMPKQGLRYIGEVEDYEYPQYTTEQILPLLENEPRKPSFLKKLMQKIQKPFLL